jgi:hypothetical protein
MAEKPGTTKNHGNPQEVKVLCKYCRRYVVLDGVDCDWRQGRCPHQSRNALIPGLIKLFRSFFQRICPW